MVVYTLLKYHSFIWMISDFQPAYIDVYIILLKNYRYIHYSSSNTDISSLGVHSKMSNNASKVEKCIDVVSLCINLLKF